MLKNRWVVTLEVDGDDTAIPTNNMPNRLLIMCGVVSNCSVVFKVFVEVLGRGVGGGGKVGGRERGRDGGMEREGGEGVHPPSTKPHYSPQPPQLPPGGRVGAPLRAHVNSRILFVFW